MRRIRRCSECGKRLGNTLGRCHEHGGENYRAGGSMNFKWAYYWKVWRFGLDPRAVREAHGK